MFLFLKILDYHQIIFKNNILFNSNFKMNSHQNYICNASILQTLIKRGVIQTRLP